MLSCLNHQSSLLFRDKKFLFFIFCVYSVCTYVLNNLFYFFEDK